MKFIIGKKIDMTQLWQGEKVVAITRVKAERCVITQLKSKDSDGYRAVQVAYGVRREKNINKPQKGHTKGLGFFAGMKEFKTEEANLAILERGSIIDANSFGAGDKIQVTATSKGKGFQGVVKRHGFKGSKKTHGNKDQLRMPGSSGATGPAHVFKGTRKCGRMGDEQVTVKNLKIAKVDENDIIYIEGAVPGARNGIVIITGEGDLKIISIEKAPAVAEVVGGEKNVNKAEETPEQVEKEIVEAKERIDKKDESGQAGE